MAIGAAMLLAAMLLLFSGCAAHRPLEVGPDWELTSDGRWVPSTLGQ
jgi:hypothetical protein